MGGAGSRFDLVDQTFDRITAVSSTLVGGCDHESPEEALLLVRLVVQHQKADRIVVCIDGLCPGGWVHVCLS